MVKVLIIYEKYLLCRDVWGKVFGRGLKAKDPKQFQSAVQSGAKIGKPAMTAWDLRNQYGKNKRGELDPKRRICYKQLAVGVIGAASPICTISFDTKCTHTSLIRAYSDFMIRGMNLQSLTHYAKASPEQTIMITFMARRASALWPEKRYCSNNASYFKCELWAEWGVRSHGRMVRNEQEILDKLRQELASDSSITIRDVDYNVLSFEEQIKLDLSTDIMVLYVMCVYIYDNDDYMIYRLVHMVLG